jgi:hypothetical protein
VTSPPVRCPTCAADLGRYAGDRFLLTPNRPGGGFRYTLGRIELRCCREWHVIPPAVELSPTAAETGDPHGAAAPSAPSAPAHSRRPASSPISPKRKVS